tara:strand:- start:1289 stop:2230 length:942 start_codon:yes stop_codon:yes gene_type:complete
VNTLEAFRTKKNQGFSLIELVVVIAVLTILAILGGPYFIRVLNMARFEAAKLVLGENYKNCINKSIQSPNAPFIPGITFQSTNCSSLMSATIDEKCTISLDMSNGAKDGWADSFGACESSSSSSNIAGKYNNNDFVVQDAAINNECSDYVILEASNWEEAEQRSKELGGNLVTINSKDEYQWLQKNVWAKNKLLNDSGDESTESTYFFTGLNDVAEEGKYVWSSGEESEFNNNEDLIHRQNWIAQQHMANNNDYFVIGGTNDRGFDGHVQQDYRPDLYNGLSGHLTWVDNDSTWLKNNGNPRHYGLAEIPVCE